MDALRISKVEDVALTKRRTKQTGTLHLTSHHLIFCRASQDEDWIPYSLIGLVTKLPQTLAGLSPLSIQTRTFETYTFTFPTVESADDVFESIKGAAVVTSLTQLYAFFYAPPKGEESGEPSTPQIFRDEFTRMGVGSRTKAWRFTELNKEGQFCPTYPQLLCIPSRISDATLTYASKYRTKNRIPVLTYLHWSNLATITRSSQPMVGMTGSRSVQDEKLIEAVFTSHQPTSVRVQQSPASPQTPPQIYGATASCLIIDARPTTNAFANNLKGAGTENMEYYPSARKAYLGIDNIHIMRDSLKGVFEALRDAEMLEDQLGDGWVDRSALRRTGWLRHISLLLDGASLIIKTIHVSASHVLIHCSDGWDRTAQLSALAQICLDPYYRTLKGFQALVEKDWIGFGHKFTDRCGHLSSEKLFLSTPLLSSAQGEGNQAQAFLATVQHKLAGQGHLKEISPVFHQFLECVFNLQLQNPKRFEFNSKLLERIFYNVYSCRFGTFLFNTASERAKHPQLASLWAWAFDEERKADWLNPDYDATLDDPLARDEAGKYGDMGVLTPNPKEVVFWTELYKREGMNPPPKPPTAVTEEGELVSGDTTPPSPPGDEVLVNVEAPTKTQSANHSSVPSPTPSPGPLSRSAPAFSSSSSTTTPVIGRTYSPPPVGLEETRSLAKSLSKDSLNLEGSAFSMRTQRNLNPGTTRSTSSVASSASNSPFPIPSLPPTTQISANVRSMWGRLSSGAAGALSAVQGAYEDLRATQNVSPSPSHSQDRELREPPQAEDGNRTMSTLPRSPVRAPVEDNPWATSSNRGQTLQRGAITDVFPAALSTSSRQNSMPYDPTITVDPLNPWASPTPNSTIRGNPLDRRTSSLKKDPLPPPPPPPTETPTPPAFSSSDPLGASTL